jgi:hypothetical protein
MANQQGQAFEDLRNTIGECSRIVRHRWLHAVIGLSVVGSAAFWCSQFLDREYAASTLFERRDDPVLQNLLSKRGSGYGFQSLKATMRFDMIGERAMSRALVRAGLLDPAKVPGMTAALSDAERKATGQVLGRYQISATMRMTQSTQALDTILLKCEANDPKVARDVVAALRDSYIDGTRVRIKEILNSATDWFESELTAKLDEAHRDEEKLNRLTQEFPNVDVTDVASLAQQKEMYRAQRDDWSYRLTGIEAEVARVQAALTEPPPDYVFMTEPLAEEMAEGQANAPRDPPAMTAIEKQIEDVRRLIVDLISNHGMTDAHPRVQGQYKRLESLKLLRNQIAREIEDERAERLAAEPPPKPKTPAEPKMTEAYRDYLAARRRDELQLETLERVLASTRASFEEADERFRKFDSLHTKLLAQNDAIQLLVDDINYSANEAKLYEQQLMELKRWSAVEGGKKGTQFTLLEEPHVAGSPVRPRVGSIVVVCSGLGLAAAALLVALAELFDRSFRSVGRVTRTLGLPVLECIAVVQTPREKRRLMLKRVVWGPTLGVLLLLLGACAMLSYSSLAMPHHYDRAIQPIDTMLRSIGLQKLSPLKLEAS